MTKRIAVSLVIASLLFAGSSSVAFAENTTTQGADITALQARVQMLMSQIESLKAMSIKQNAQIQELRAELKLTKKLRMGDKGEEVKVLQQMLSTDPAIFPEGMVTGTFGPLTAKALKRFQEKAGLEGVGEVGPRTLVLLNKFLAQGGAGNSGHVPEGLLRKAGGMITVPLMMQNNSGLMGYAMISDNASGTAVVRVKMTMKSMGGDREKDEKMHMMNMGTSTYPAHIHAGSCPTPGAVVYPLTAITSGMSETVLATSTKSLIRSFPLAINVHKSSTDMSTYVSCGDLKAPPMLWKMGGDDHKKGMGMDDDHDDDNDDEHKVPGSTGNSMHQ